MDNSLYKVRPVNKPLYIDVRVPGSKSITNRALLLACLARGESRLHNVLFSDDSRHFIDCVRRLGYKINVDEQERTVTLAGGEPLSGATINVGGAGTAARFITAMLAAYSGEYVIEASPQMEARPMKPLFMALAELGAEVRYLKDEYHLPVRLRGGKLGGGSLKGGKLKGGEIKLDVSKSSQFLSALLMVGCLCENDLKVVPTGKEIARPYIDITLRMIGQFGGKAEHVNYYLVKSGNTYMSQDYVIEPDVSSACYFYAMAFLAGGEAIVEGVRFDSMQGDVKFIRLLERMGARLEDTDRGIRLVAPRGGTYQGVDVDMDEYSDQAMTLAVLAIYAATPTTIRGIGHIRYQESDRIRAMVTELARMGIDADETEDGLTIYPGMPRPTLVETYDDHRMAMAFSLAGLRSPGITIGNPGCTAKTFEGYFELFEHFCG